MRVAGNENDPRFAKQTVVVIHMGTR
jgi:hypothetical protein